MSSTKQYGPHNPRRVLGHALKDALARSWRAAAALGGRLLTHGPADSDLAELRRGLAEADNIAEALLDREPQISAPPPLDVGSLLSRMEPSLNLALGPTVHLTIQGSEPRHLVSADVNTLEALVRRLVEGAGQATPEGGELTLSTGWLDSISGNWPADRIPPRRYVRLTVATNASERPGDAWWRVIEPAHGSSKSGNGSAAAMIGRLHGCIMVESAEGQPSRIHVCLPAVFEDSEN